MQEMDKDAEAFSIEDKEAIEKIKQQEEIIFSYPVQYSNIPKILQDYINQYGDLWHNKKVFVIATMGLFSGDGAGMLARLLQKYGAEIVGGMHLKMPDSIGDEKALKRPLERNQKLVADATEKIKAAVKDIKDGKPPQEGIGFLYHMAGLFGQRLYFIHKTRNYTGRLKIDSEKCIGCGKCVSLCPLKNISMKNISMKYISIKNTTIKNNPLKNTSVSDIYKKKIDISDNSVQNGNIKFKCAVSGNRCTMCYRCVNNCPSQAITLLGKNVIEQSTIEKYLL